MLVFTSHQSRFCGEKNVYMPGVPLLSLQGAQDFIEEPKPRMTVGIVIS